MEAGVRPARFLDVARTVLAGMLGVRRRAQHESQSTGIRPLHIIIAGVIAAAAFVVLLVAVVRLVAG